jgi:hypothetical protein
MSKPTQELPPQSHVATLKTKIERKKKEATAPAKQKSSASRGLL